MVVVGLLSEIGCGKSTVAKMFAALGARVIDADKIVAKLCRENSRANAAIAKEFGEGVLGNGGKIDRELLAEAVFGSKKELKKLNAIIHPLVFAELRRKLKEFRGKVIVLDVPLLLESNMDALADVLVAVKAGKKQQFARLKQRGIMPSDAKRRIAMQIPLREKVKLADCVINNSASPASTRKQVGEIWKKLEAGVK